MSVSKGGADGEKSLYEVLDVEPDASADEIRRAFHRFALRYHPDRYPTLGDEERARLEVWYRRGTEAYRVLSDPVSRRAHDARLGVRRSEGVAARGRRSPSPSSARLRVRNPRARPFVRKAQRAMAVGDWNAAAFHLRLALQYEPDNELLQAQLAEAEQGAARGG